MQQERSCFGHECSNAGSGLKNENQAAGSESEGEKKKCDVRFSIIRKHRVCQNNYMRTGVRKLLSTALVLARAWRGQAVGLAPSERLKLRRQMTAAAGKKESVSLSLSLLGGE